MDTITAGSTVERIADKHGDWLAIAVGLYLLIVMPEAFDGDWAGIALAVIAIPTAIVVISLARDLQRMYEKRAGE